MKAQLAIVMMTSLLIASCGPKPLTDSTAREKAVSTSLLTVKVQDLPKTYEATGTVRARLNATLASKVVGRVTDIRVREGDRAAAGQTLVSLDSRELNAAVSVATATYDAAHAAELNAATYSKMESGTSQARIAGAEFQVEQAKAGLALAQSRLELALAGPRPQERAQARLATEQARAAFGLAQSDFERTKSLESAGAVPKRQLDAAKAASDVAKAQFESAQEAERIAKEGTRNEDLSAARQAVEQARAGLKATEAALRQARSAGLAVQLRAGEQKSAQAQARLSAASLQSAEVALGYAVVPAPFDGVVVRRYVDPGSFASIGTPLIGVEGGGYRLEVSVPESVLPHLTTGQELDIELDAVPGFRKAKLVEIVPQGEPASHTFLARLDLSASAQVRTGMFGRARILTGTRQGIRIPSGALLSRQGLQYVYVVGQDGIVRLRVVTAGESSGAETEILSGLESGDRIATTNLHLLSDGVRISQ